MSPQQPQIPPEMQIYVNCMDKVKQRIGVVNWAVVSVYVFQQDHFIFTELIFVQFRKILELIAYSSLSANKEKYAEANAQFAEHWKAVWMLDALEKINPQFYPVPVEVTEEAGKKLLTPITDGFLTKEDFAKLYDASSDQTSCICGIRSLPKIQRFRSATAFRNGLLEFSVYSGCTSSTSSTKTKNGLWISL